MATHIIFIEGDAVASSAYVYILANRCRGALYIGVTTNLIRRIYDHRTDPHGFVRCYGLYNLVYYTGFRQKWYGIDREKSMKKWKRVMKIELIEQMNPEWKDLAADWEYVSSDGERIQLSNIPRKKGSRVARHCYCYAYRSKK